MSTPSPSLTPEQRLSLWIAAAAGTPAASNPDAWADAAARHAAALEKRFLAGLSSLPRRELPGRIVSVEEQTRRRDGSPAGYAIVRFEAAIGANRMETLYVNRALPGGEVDAAGMALIERCRQLVGQPATITKEGRNERVGAGGRLEHSWYVVEVEPLAAAAAPTSTSTPAPAPVEAPTPAPPASPVPAEAPVAEAPASAELAPDFAALRSFRPRAWEELVAHAHEFLGLDEPACRRAAHATLRQAELDTASRSPARVRVVWARLVEQAARAAEAA